MRLSCRLVALVLLLVVQPARADRPGAARFEPARVQRLSRAWSQEVLSGKLRPSQFYSRHGTSKREITELRKQSQFKGMFGSATGVHNASRKQTHSSSMIGRLSRLWKSSVVPGEQSITEFKKQHNLTQRGYTELRKQHPTEFPKPTRIKHAGSPPRRTFTDAQLERMKADWQQVLSFKLDRKTFMRRYRMHSKMFKRLRDNHPGAFPSMSNKDKLVRFGPQQMKKMKVGWLEVLANRKREVDFRADHNLSTGLFSRLRGELQNAPDFPKLNRSLGRGSSSALTSARVVADWSKVRAGSLSAAAFHQRHPDVRAEQLLLANEQIKAAERKRGTGIDPEKLSELKRQWTRVVRRETTQTALLEDLGISERRFRSYKKAHASEFPGPAPRPRPEPKPRPPGKYQRQDAVYTRAQLDGARALFSRYHRGEIDYESGVKPGLERLGMATSNQSLVYLRRLDPQAFSSRKSYLARNHDAMIDDLIRIAKDHRHVISSWSELVEVVNREQSFPSRWGDVGLKPGLGILEKDRRGAGRLYSVMKQIGQQVGKPSGPRGPLDRAADRITRSTKSPPPRLEDSERSRRDSARTLVRALRGKQPSRATLEREVARLAKSDSNFSTRRKWLSIRSNFEGVMPDLQRWNFDTHRPYSLRYVARWTEAAHQAGPGASYEQIASIFKRSPEYREDGRVPPKAMGTQGLSSEYPKLISSWANRRTYQRTRQLLELLRTAPQGTTLYKLKDRLKEIGFAYSYAHKWLNRLTPEEAQRHGMDRDTFARLQRGGFRGLGLEPTARFDPNAEPPEVNIQLVKEILATPTMPPMLEFAIKRLDGQRPFKGHNVMFINHRYSDIVSFVDAMTRAGMNKENALFVSTPYPFRDAVTYQLRRRGIRTWVPRQSVASYEHVVTRGLMRMLALYNRQERKTGRGDPILVLDDGGMAAKIIDKRFPQHAGKFRIVEVTAAGHRMAQQFEKKRKRLPFVYYSIAYSETKRNVTSNFYGTRVVDRLLNLIPQSGVELSNRRATVLGGGPMGLAAGRRLRELGYEVTFVDPSAEAAAKLRRLKFSVQPLNKALPGRSIILGMSGYLSIKATDLKYIDNDAVVAQGSSKRQEFQMDAIEKLAASKTLLPRKDGLAQKSFTYAFGPRARQKKLHFLGDGWTINHDGSLHGTPMRDIQLELSLYFEHAVRAAKTHLRDTGVFRTLDAKTQELYVDTWKRLIRR